MPLIQINNLDELLKLVAKQKAVVTKTMRELGREMDTTPLLYRADHTLTEATTSEITRKTVVLLSKYAAQPTLSEFYQHPSWDGGFAWGGSFAISAIIGTVFMKSWADIFPEFAKIVKPVLMRVLEEQSKEDEDDTSLIDRILPSMKFTIRDQHGAEILGKQRDSMIYHRVASLLQLIAQSFVTYGILETPEQKTNVPEGQQVVTRLTPLGLRVYAHLVDVEIYITEISEVYPRLSQNKVIAE